MLAALLLAAGGSASAQLAQTEFEFVDSNHDGRVSSGEYETYAKLLYDRMDEDPDDDQLTAAEVRANADTFFHYVYAGGNMLGPAELSHTEILHRLDANQDGLISQTEYLTGARARYQKLDLKSDGELSPEEFGG